MLHRTLSRINRLLGKFDCPPILNRARMSTPVKPRLSLESLDPRIVPANLVFTNEGGTGLMETVANWRDRDTYQPVLAAPVQSDSLFFDGTRSDAHLTNLHGFDLPETTADFASISFINNYAGTVTLAPDATPGLTVGTFTLTSGAIAQPGGVAPPIDPEFAAQSGAGVNPDPVPIGSTDLSVLGTFTWTGGILNSTPSAATVNIYGGGTITLPGEGNTITTGSTLNFASLGSQVMTTISGAGNLLLNGLSQDGIFVRENASVKVIAPEGANQNIDAANGAATLSLDPGSSYGYVGSIGAGMSRTGLRVINYGGRFFLGDPATGRTVSVLLTAGDQNTPSYMNYWLPFTPWDPRLEIMNGCTLVAGHGVAINAGTVWLIGNSSIGANAQVATIQGDFWMTGGVIGFLTPTEIEGELVWGEFHVAGDAFWSGGQFNPGLDCRAGNSTKANKWTITGDLTITNNPNQSTHPTINPVAQLVPEGGGIPQRQWSVIEVGMNGQILGDNPSTSQGWNLLPVINANGVKKSFRVEPA